MPADSDPASSQPFRLGYRPALDGIRGAAVLAVMLFHFGAPFDQGGFLGVDAFFVLSGFLITALLIEEWSRTGGIAFRRFYTRRALRLLPALFAMLLLVTVVVALIAPRDVQEATWRGTVVTLLYAANWQKVFSSQSVGLLGHTWSLSIEEQFYVLWPPLLLLLLRHRLSLHWLTLVAAVLAVASASTRALMMMSVTSMTLPRSGTRRVMAILPDSESRRSMSGAVVDSCRPRSRR